MKKNAKGLSRYCLPLLNCYSKLNLLRGINKTQQGIIVEQYGGQS